MDSLASFLIGAFIIFLLMLVVRQLSDDQKARLGAFLGLTDPVKPETPFGRDNGHIEYIEISHQVCTGQDTNLPSPA